MNMNKGIIPPNDLPHTTSITPRKSDLVPASRLAPASNKAPSQITTTYTHTSLPNTLQSPPQNIIPPHTVPIPQTTHHSSTWYSTYLHYPSSPSRPPGQSCKRTDTMDRTNEELCSRYVRTTPTQQTAKQDKKKKDVSKTHA